MWFFGGKDKDKKDNKAAPAAPAAQNLTFKQQKAQELLSLMRTARAEIGEEQLQAMVRKMKLEDLKNQIKGDIDNNPHKRERLLDAIRYEMHDADRDPKKR